MGEIVEVVTDQNFFFHGLCFSESDSEIGIYDQKIGKMKINQMKIAEKRPITEKMRWKFYWNNILNKLNTIDGEIVKTDQEIGAAFRIALERAKVMLYGNRR